MGQTTQAFAPADDDLHTASDSWYENETFWFSFWVPERSIGAWLYTGVRAQPGVTTGGLYLWDDSGANPWDAPFFEDFKWLKAPPARQDRTLAFPNGMTVTTVEPGMVYDLAYTDRSRVTVSLRFEGLEVPVPLLAGQPPYPLAHHYDQTGRVTGHVTLDGQRIDIDCYAMRDRSWGPRTERGFHRIGYTWMASPELSVLTYARSGSSLSHDDIYLGYVRRGDVVSKIVSGERVAERDPAEGWIQTLSLRFTDEHGDSFSATAQARNRLILPGGTNVCVNTGLDWTQADGSVLHGEDQDVWPLQEFRRLRHG